jgi:hypothetical protein
LTRFTRILFCAAVLSALLATGCGVDTPAPAVLDRIPVGAEHFTDYVAIGNSLTAGYMDGGLVVSGQRGSYPRLLASAMAAKAHTFEQPLIDFPGVGSTELDDPDEVAGIIYYIHGGGFDLTGPTPKDDVPDLLLNKEHPIPYNNLGVPGATAGDVGSALDSNSSQTPGNAFFDLVLRNPDFGDVVIRDQAIALGPKLITCWIGNNDILDGATDGEPVVGDNITPTGEYTATLTTLLDDLTTGIDERFGYEPAIFLGNIPSISSAPYFVPKDLFDLMAFGGQYEIETVEEAVYVLFPALYYLADGGLPPLPEEHTLDAAEVAVVETAVTEYNAAIAAAAAARDNVWLYDANAVLAGLEGMPEAKHFLELLADMDVAEAAATTYFSLDGIHPNNRGYGLVANGFIDVINEALDTALPHVDIDGLVWDPTYGQTDKAAPGGPLLTAEAARAMDAVFR